MKKILFTEEFCQPEQLFPFTLTRQIQDIRLGILSIREKWELFLGLPSFDKYEDDYKDLDRAMVLNGKMGKDLIYLIHGNVLPSSRLVGQVKKLKPGDCLTVPGKESFVFCISAAQVEAPHRIKVGRAIDYADELKEIRQPWDLFNLNRWALEEDLKLVAGKRKSARLSPTNKIIGKGKVFIEKGAWMEHCLLNTTDGPIYIGKGATVMEGSLLRGPVSIGEGSVVKMGTKIYGATTVGPFCTVGGEVKNSIFFGYSNKAHDGYLGDSIIGEWCNMGAGTSNSNVKNNASNVVVYTPNGQVNVGLKCGVLMGDYSRTAINTSINTGTVIGVSCNIFGNGLTPKHIPSFSWGSDGVERYRFEKALEDIQNWKSLKGHVVNGSEKTILKYIFEHY